MVSVDIIIYTHTHTHIHTRTCTHRRWVDERIVFMMGMFIIAFGFFAVLPMSNEYPDVIMKGEGERGTHYNGPRTEI